MDTFLRDVRYAVRGLAHERFFTAVTVLTLALGIGAVTALFAVVDAVLLRPVVPDQDRVVYVSKLDVQRGGFPHALSLPEFAAWRERSRSFEVLAAVDHAATGVTTIAIGAESSPVRLAPVSADFFRVAAGGAPLHGRWLQEEDERPGVDVAAVVSERLWRRVSGSDPAFVGRRLTWAGTRTLVVVGIAPAALDYPLNTDIWAAAARVFDGQDGRFDASSYTFTQFELIGRLAPGVSIAQVQAELSAIHRQVVNELPSTAAAMQVIVEPLIETVVGNGRQILLVLFAAAGLVFLIAGVNVATLLLMRTRGRHVEMAVRVALGAGRARLLRGTMAEGLVLGLLAAIGGLAIARALLATAHWLAPADVPRLEQAGIDPAVLAFCGLTAIVWVLMLGTAPVWAHARLVRASAVPDTRGAVRGGRGLLVFAVAEVAAAVVVAVGAGLLMRSFTHLQAIDRGFAADNLSMISLLLPESRQRDPRAMLAFYQLLLPRVTALPGVRSASPVHVAPGSGTLGLSAPMRFEGQAADEAQSNPWSTWEPVLPSYFETLGIPILRGRAFSDSDRTDDAPVAIVSEAVARRYWPGRDAIGQRLQFVAGSEWPWVTVVGVVPDTRYRELTKPWMTVYFPADQFFYFQAASLVVRTTTPIQALAPAIQRAIDAIAPGTTIRSVDAVDALLARELARPLTALVVTSLFALLAILLAAVGVYGVLAYDVRQRRRELALRSAIGATPARIFRDVVLRSLRVGVAGAVVGVVAATAMTHVLQTILFEVQPLDPRVFAAASTALLCVALLASYLPARRAAATDPALGLQQD